jgi:hypothetical protein
MATSEFTIIIKYKEINLAVHTEIQKGGRGAF